jgi:hypothetical protein
MKSPSVCCLVLVCVVAAAIPARAAQTPSASVAVKQWDRFEQALENPRSYRDPYRDVTLAVTFTRPDGTTVPFWGFYDGGRTWRFRFMPDQVGTWKFSAAFSDGVRGATGTFACVESDIPGMLAAHAANPMWFGFRQGEAALIRGLHVGDRFFARNWDDPANHADGEKRTAFLDWLQEQGYNLLSIGSHYLNRNAPGRGAGWETPRLWPLDAAEYRQMEAILDELARRKILVFPFAGFFGRDGNFPQDAGGRELYVNYTYARIGVYWNTLLNVVGPEPMLRGKPFFELPELARIGRMIQAANVFGKPLSVHNRTGSDEYRDEPWTNYGILQGPKTIERRQLSRGLLESHHPEKPLLAQETLWSGNINHIKRFDRDYTNEELRKNAFVIHFSAAALVFADNDGDSSSGFSGTMDLHDRQQERHDVIKRVWDICATVPFGRLRPRQDLVTGEHAYCLADPGRHYAVYLDRSAPVSVQLPAARDTAGGYRVTWIDAQRGDRRDGGTTRDGRNLTPPGGGDDWVLVLAAATAEPIVYRAAADFVPVAQGFGEAYPEARAGDASLHGLAVNPKTSQDRFAAADVTFTGPAGVYDLRLLALAEEDGESVYQLKVGERSLGQRANPVTKEKRQPVWHEWSNVRLEPGMRIRVLFAGRSNGRYPEGDAFAWSRGRWRMLEAFPVAPSHPQQ